MQEGHHQNPIDVMRPTRKGRLKSNKTESNEKPTPMNQKNKEKHIEDNSKKQGDHGGPISPPANTNESEVIEGNKNPTPSVLHEKKNENWSKKQGDHGRPISPTGSYKGTKAAVSRKNEKTTVPVHHQKKKEKGGVLNSTVSTKSDILIDGYKLNYLFQVQLTHNYVRNKMVPIPTKEAEEHFPPLKKCDGNYIEVGIQLYDPEYIKRWMRFKFPKLCDDSYSYMIAGRWAEFVDAHELKASDVIRVFKVSKPEPVKHYFIDYVRAEEVAGATVTQSCRPGKNRGGDSDDRGGGGSKKHGHGGSSLGVGNQETVPLKWN
ncbi:unnamed protein product [Camellia sinensis]